MTKRLRIFLSSPGDVSEERLRAHLVVQKLARDYARFFRIEAYLWEHEPMLASGHFQDAIEPPSACDVLVLIVFARLGTSLPARTELRDYRGIDGRVPVTGTEWEFEEALQAHRTLGTPDLLAYRKLGDPGASLADPIRRAEQERQWDALQAFWRRHFENGGMFLAGSAEFRTLEEFDQKLEAHLTTLIEKRIAEGLAAEEGTEPLWFRGSPFRGLAAYDFDDAAVFFGRDAQTRSALTRLQAAAEHGCAFLLILGASGSGKSSLARAGILPGLLGPKAVPGVGLWRRVVLRPGDGPDPVRVLADAVAVGGPDGVGLPEILGPGLSVHTFAAHLAAAPDDPAFPFRVALERVAEAARGGGLLPHESARLVILVDQVEEIFTHTVDPQRRDLFLRILTGLARSGVVWIVATLRNDLWHHVALSPVLLALVESGGRLDLAPPDGAEIIEIIRRPAKAAGLVFETVPETGVGLDAVLARAAAEEPGALPLLSVMLDTLYRRDIENAAESGAVRHMLKIETYRALGELRGAIARRADEVLEFLRSSDPEAAASLPRVLRALVTAVAAERVTSRPTRRDRFSENGPEARLIEAFLAPGARLLVSSGAEDLSDIRLAHESLLENWPTAREQIARDRRDLETRARLEALERRWLEAADSEKMGALLTGINLAEGADLVRRWQLTHIEGLGLFITLSERADRLRRNRLLIAAAALVLLFGGVAAAAGLEWSRAEEQAKVAQIAAAAERDARAVAERDRIEADRQRARADSERSRALSNEQRALAALRDTKRQTTRTLAAQAELAVGQGDVRRALALAVEAGRMEQDVRASGEPAASEPALLQAVADVREVLQIRGSAKTWVMPYDFFGNERLVYADKSAGLVLVDLSSAPRVTAKAKLPEGDVPNQIRTLPSSGLVAVATGQHLVLVDARDGRIVATLSLPARITSLDAHEQTGMIAVGIGAAVGLVRIENPQAPEIISIPSARGGLNVGQVHFDSTGQHLYVAYGLAVLDLNPQSGRFADGPITELDYGNPGIDRHLHEQILEQGKGLVSLVDMAPDPTQARILFRSSLDLRSFDAATGATKVLDRGGADQLVLGLSFINQDRTQPPKQAVAVLGRRTSIDQEFKLSYIMDDDSLLQFESFSVRAEDLNGEKIHSCRVSANASYLACEFRGDQEKGIAVWRLLGGTHRFEHSFSVSASSAVLDGSRASGIFVGSDEAITAIHGDREARLATLSQGWQLTKFQEPYLSAASQSEIRVWKSMAGSLEPVLGPVEAKSIAVDPIRGRAFLSQKDHLTAVDLSTGKALWTAPGLLGLMTAAVSTSGQELVAVIARSVYRFDAPTGRLLNSVPIVADGPVAIDPSGDRLAFTDDSGIVRLLEPQLSASGAAQK
ncbi:hypothetical protein ACRAWG_29325 [Methylobacterium sp. P31]